jgi:putative solute:sodium symporter small subunit
MPEVARDSPDRAELASRRRAHWRAIQRWTVGLLIVWGLVTFGVAFHARALDFSFFGWPFSFWVGAQGATLVYLLLVGLYAWAARRLDEAHDLDELP